MKKIGLDDYLKTHTVSDLLKLKRLNLNSKEFEGFETWHSDWKQKKYESDAYSPIGASERKWVTGEELKKMPLPKLEWIWSDYAAKTLITLISAYPKVGKTTLLRLLLYRLVQSKASPGRDFLGKRIFLKGKILILTEEPPVLFKEKAEEFGLFHPDLMILFRSKIENWSEALAQAIKAIKDEDIAMLVIDTLAEFWDARDENDAPSVLRALKLLKKIAHEKGVAVLIFHHTRKGGGEGGEAPRGSSAIAGAIDIAIEMRPDRTSPNKRILTTRSRVGNVSDQIIELVENDYVSLGTVEDNKREAVVQRVMQALPSAEENPISREALMGKLDPKPSATSIKEILAESCEIEKIGAGRRGDPLLYRKKAKKIIESATLKTVQEFTKKLQGLQPLWVSARKRALRKVAQ